MKKPDKLPTIDSQSPNLYRQILDAARTVRAHRQMEAALDWAEIRAKRVESLALLKRVESA